MDLLLNYRHEYDVSVINIKAAYAGKCMEFYAPSKIFSALAFQSVYDQRYLPILGYLLSNGMSNSQIYQIKKLFEPKLLPKTPIKDIRDYFSHGYALVDGPFKIDTTGLSIDEWEWLYLIDMMYTLTDVIILLVELHSAVP